MVRVLGRLPFLGRRRDSAASNALAVRDSPIDPDSAPVGPPILLPATIFRQVLVDGTELTPVWARPRAAATSDGAPSTDKPRVTKRARQQKASAPAADRAASGTKRSPSTRKRTNSA